MTKSMLEKCLNKECAAYGKLSEDVKELISKNYLHAEILVGWPEVWKSTRSWSHERIVRLSPDTPTEPEVDYVEYDITINEDGWYCFSIPQGRPFAGSYWNFTFVLGRDDGLGIVYRDSNGVETLRTSVDAAFGTPVRVRFAKGE